MELRRIKARGRLHLTTRLRARDIETALPIDSLLWTDVQRQEALTVHAERDRNQDRVELIALHILEVLDEQTLAVAA